MSTFRSVIIGNESLAVQCGEMLLEAGHPIAAVVTRNRDVGDWATSHDLPVHMPGADLASQLAGLSFDWLFSIANLDLIPQAVLDMAAKGAVNFHDGPLPRYAGLNAPVWALINREERHGITWHMISGGIDKGDIIAQSEFAITERDTGLTLNTKCYSAAIESFGTVIAALASGAPDTAAQDLSQRSYFARDDRPEAAGRLDFSQPAEALSALVRALDHGDYWNPLCCPKIAAKSRIWLLRTASIAEEESDAAPGTVIAADAETLTVATRTRPVVLGGFRDGYGAIVRADSVASPGDSLPSVTAQEAEQIAAALSAALPAEAHWRARLETLNHPELPLIDTGAKSGQTIRHALTLPETGHPEILQAALAILVARLGDTDQVDIAWRVPDGPENLQNGYISDWSPVRCEAGQSVAALRDTLAADIGAARDLGGFPCDLAARIPGLSHPWIPAIGLSDCMLQDPIGGTSLTLAMADGRATLIADGGHVTQDALGLIAARLEYLYAQVGDSAAGELDVANLQMLPQTEQDLILRKWNDTATDYEEAACIHELFEAQAGRTPDAEAIVFEGETLTYAQLNTRASQAAHILRDMGVRPGTLVGLHVRRSAELLIGALAILKAGGGYVPMDPAYPADRTALYIEDSAAPVVVTQSDLASTLPPHGAQILLLDSAQVRGEPRQDTPASGVTSGDLAYVIYTSGSTGRPKGVMIEHRNVSNFFTGMDARIRHEPPGVWLAVTSLSFDISVLELFWTLARGFKLILSSDENRALVAGTSPQPRALSGKGMEFSLYYWGDDDKPGRDKYRLLLDGARFADENGFCAVWTPERHFHAFGGPYPNPSVTGAAVAAVTRNIAVRAGSCVAPLHHTARIAEEWSVIDNLTNGRAGLAIASGWQPDDFVLKPENTPPQNKTAMFDTIRDLRKLWKGEPVAFARQNGEMHPVLTQPRPVSDAPELWVTTAGNPETWKDAGRHGCHILTHLLGQSVDEVEEKISLYHAELRNAGHDPDDFKVTLLLHTFVAETREKARDVASGPMKNYLRSAAGLIKQYAWAFPAFKKPEGVTNPFELDLGELEPDEMEGILDFAFERYFEDSGLFGTVEDCLDRVEQLKRIGVSEIACLIEYGIPVDQVLEGLKPLAEVLQRSNTAQTMPDDDFSIAAQIIRHDVTHMQCTPSMAQMLLMNDEARHALKKIGHMMIGGEALPGSMVSELAALTGAHIENMYGPTETTIWSTTRTAHPVEGVVDIGRPIANTQTYVLDENLHPVPVGHSGELYIAGAGVARGYWQREDLTAERFLDNPFAGSGSGVRMYRTGDLARWRADGRLDFLGRADHQVKLRGYRIELGEIESVLDAFPGVRQSVVMAREDTPGLIQLVAYLITEAPVSESHLRERVTANLPGYMMPAHFVTLDSFPLTPNKKIDRKALPAPAPRTAAAQPATAAVPATGGTTVQQVAAIWSRILGIPGIGARDNFFDLGGHSLLAVQAHREIRTQLAVPQLSITDIFRFPTLSALSAIIDEKSGRSGSEQPENGPDADDRAASRSDAMSRRRAMRAKRLPSSA